jgi:tetratricopeptide (TPR) repeat protein
MGKGEYDRAIQDFDQVIRLAPDQAAGFSNRAFAYLKLQKADLAIADYDTALRTNPKNPFALYGRGMARRLHGDTAGSDADIAAAQQIKADVAEHFRGH